MSCRRTLSGKEGIGREPAGSLLIETYSYCFHEGT